MAILLFLLLLLLFQGSLLEGTSQGISSCTAHWNLAVFGDFLSSPGYPGQKWPDFLRVASLHNFAQPPVHLGDEKHSNLLSEQMNGFSTLSEWDKGPPNNYCAVIWIGAYDFFQFATPDEDAAPAAPSTSLYTAVERFRQGFGFIVQELVKAKLKCIFIFTQLDAGYFPAVQALRQDRPAQAHAIQLAVEFTNAILVDVVSTFSSKVPELKVLNTSEAFDHALAYTQTRKPRWKYGPCFESPPNKSVTPCKNTVWWDTMNPSSSFQRLMAHYIANQMCGQSGDVEDPREEEEDEEHRALLWLLLLLLLIPFGVCLWIWGWQHGARHAATSSEMLPESVGPTPSDIKDTRIDSVVVDSTMNSPCSPGFEFSTSSGTALHADHSQDSAALLHRPSAPLSDSCMVSETAESASRGDRNLESRGPQSAQHQMQDTAMTGFESYTCSTVGYESTDQLQGVDLQLPLPRVDVLLHKHGLGRGANGQVFTGTLLSKGTTVAIKVLATTNSMVPKVTQEMQLLYEMRHPNIVQCFGYFAVPGRIGIVMEYVPRTLGQAIQELHEAGCISEPLAKEYSVQILTGMQYIHSRNVLHRDLKPANILIDTHGTCKIADFGCSKELCDISATLPSCAGTPQYMAPEVMFGGPAHFGSDIWSFACIVYEMIVGQAPWHQVLKNTEICSAVQFFIQVSRIGGTPLCSEDGIPDDATAFLSPCFSRTPQERPSCSQLLQHFWLVGQPRDHSEVTIGM